MAAAKNVEEMDFVYQAENTGDYKNARIAVAVKDDKYEITVEPEEPITRVEMDSIIVGVENDILRKLRIDLMDECYVTLIYDGQSYAIELAGDPPRAADPFPVILGSETK